MRSSMSWEDLAVITDGTLDTLYMVGWRPVYRADRAAHRCVVIYFLRQRAGADAKLNALLGAVINIGRSLPFIVLLIALIPLPA